ncbi:diaminopimelate epimerase [Rhabdochlamydiaceae symbiont of Dictyostelium giganteum]|uniref:diaminopimelate epimerase n=1 Tax=Rhabdochlamydiaceae symbiont of Dictyostelium giganteum TaxID=3342349 RepID=UPI00384D7B67
MLLPFDKYHASGNDFIVMDDREERIALLGPSFILHLCDRREGIGADGVLLLQNSSRANFRMRIFNADGKEASMCGNGLRSLTHFASRHKLMSTSLSIEIGDHIAYGSIHESLQKSPDGSIKEESLTVEWGPYHLIHEEPVRIEGYDFYGINTGVPHSVTFTDHHDDFLRLAPRVRRHFFMGEEGSNVSFVVLKEEGLYIRTFERGVEQETLSCGSAAAAAAVLARKKYDLKGSVQVVPFSGEKIVVECDEDHMKLHGKATFVFHGSIMYNELSKKMRSIP